ncbi:permease prefix domain 1-containing protein [Glycomyces sp. TRM65418]|uniref:permease prefix domain 1-containing protein n=1 Tax=Glycomyces sp. TRM65418 TaxID=2867006 RepID=UPI001CE5CEA8|nr:permease prefix domain 1-containing protein [Glycomyces sp. TRM65418]MCC3765496.1 permease prefix domain 1-containing protein [Glycomyces sp. TRM65418]QZD55103.1 permease prefix domain 1-containing protein [Glycomyces sp. TRM65418]
MNEYVEQVAAPLRGPRRLRADMLAELGDGFEEAVAELMDAGFARDRAVADAAAEFGPPPLVAAELQRELAAAQAHRTAWTLLIALPALTIMWDLFGGEGDPGLAVTLLARLTDLATAAAFTVAALVVARRLEGRAVLCGAVGLAQIAVALGCAALIAVVGPRGEGGPAPLAWLALQAASIAASVWIAGSAFRSVRVGRAAT